MRDDLNRAAEILASALLTDHRIVDLSGCEVIASAHARLDEALVMPQVKIGFRPIFGDKNLTVLEGTHGAGIDVDVGIKLEQSDAKATRFEQGRHRGSCDSFAQR